MRPPRSHPAVPGLLRSRAAAFLLASAVACAAACSSSSGSDDTPNFLRGTVTGPSGAPVVGATVYLVPNTAVSTLPITPAGVLAGSTEAFDEPLEDAVASGGAGFPQATTSDSGGYEIAEVPDGRFFLFVVPAADDAEHFPGGSLCRESVEASTLRGTTRDMVVSSSPPADANFIGTSSCLVCHPDYASEKTLAHRLGFRVPGVSSDLQDTSAHPEIDDGLEFFKSASSYTGGTPVYHYDPDFSRGFDDFKTSLTDPTPDGGVVFAILWLWRQGGEYRVTIENVGNPADPSSPATRTVALTYGGAVQKQRYMIQWPGLKGLYPLLQFQTEGDDARFDRTRKTFRDYHLDFYWDRSGTNADPSDDLIAMPSGTRNIQRNCMGCHAANYSQYTDEDTGEVLCRTLIDPNGEYDIDGDGFINDLNTGCENCHGPGSKHSEVQEKRWILSPEYLSPSRGNQLCGRCHNRQLGADAIGNDHPLNAEGEFPYPGISRAEFLAEYVDEDAKGPQPSAYWTDFLHSKSHHQQYPDMVTSAHYRNPYRLLDCNDCHNMHGGTGHPRALIEDPDAPDTPLCMICHGPFLSGTAEHTAALLGVTHGPAVASCVDCHMTQTAKTGSGRYGYALAPPTGTDADATTIYHENDITSHVFDVPGKDNPGVAGVTPINAMPIPYTQKCGTCHDPSQLQNN